MTVLIVGLVIFIGIHSIRAVAAPWRDAQIARFGAAGWRAAFGVVSITGLVLTIHGYALSRRAPVFVWIPPFWMAHVTALLTVIAFVLIVAGFVRGNHIKRALGRPLPCGIAFWALGHLLANGTLNDIVLFGALFLWSLMLAVVSIRRDRDAGVVPPAGSLSRDALVVAIGVLAWAVFVFDLHGPLIGVRPLG
ncbi:MAG TPA: NnrU family protein [Paraburkholderia sp.]|jgi:uncharacterized membrane protein|nr:NnrU family protein [Paraburkholderia sp.]